MNKIAAIPEAAIQIEVKGEKAREIVAKLSDRIAAMCDDPNTDLGQAKQEGAMITVVSGEIENSWFGRQFKDDGMRMDAEFFMMPPFIF